VLIKKRIIEAGYPPKIILREELIHASSMLEDFYKKRDFQPAWIGSEGPLTQVDHLTNAIEEADLEGLTPDYYHLTSIKTLLREVRETRKKKTLLISEIMADLDLLLTDAFLLLGCHFSAGCVNPTTIETKWFAKQGEVDVASVFEEALRENSIKESLKNLLPPQDSYSRLRQALVFYREIAAAGGWPTVAKGKLLKKGDEDNRINDLRKRFVVTGFLHPEESDLGGLFDEALEQAVFRFQRPHGLKADGVVGPATLKALNIPAEARARQIEINMERMRWTLRNLGQQYIIVNIADFALGVVDNGRTVLSMNVVAGKPFWHTPVFSGKVKYMVLNPSWNIPRSIAVADILPKIQKDAEYLVRQNIKVIRGWGADSEEIDPETIDWNTVNDNNFNVRLRQEPGPLNPLGRIKFVFPNRFGVYLHDTPSKGLFARHIRIFSHGCIRLEKPIDLAAYLLRDDPYWTREKILAAIETGKEQVVRLPKYIDVHILYLTAWVDEDGSLQFRDDIYGRDERLDKALRKKPPTP